MKQLLYTLLLIALSSVSLADDEVVAILNIDDLSSQGVIKSSFLDLKEDIDESNESGKRLMIFFHQNGCPYCEKLLNQNFQIKSIADELKDNYEIIELNIWGDREVTSLDGQVMTEKDFASDMKVKFTPTIIILDENGNKAFRMNGYYHPKRFLSALQFSSKENKKDISFNKYLAVRNENKNEDISTYISKPPFVLSEKYFESQKPYLIVFEDKSCKWCKDLHNDYFKRPEINNILDKLNVVVLDKNSTIPIKTPNGDTLKVNAWAEKLKVHYSPSLVFMNNKGVELFRTESYLRPFHIESILDYVVSKQYVDGINLQRYISDRATKLESTGRKIDLWN